MTEGSRRGWFSNRCPRCAPVITERGEGTGAVAGDGAGAGTRHRRRGAGERPRRADGSTARGSGPFVPFGPRASDAVPALFHHRGRHGAALSGDRKARCPRPAQRVGSSLPPPGLPPPQPAGRRGARAVSTGSTAR